MVWRVWNEGKDSYREIMYEWTYEELLKANAILDFQQSIDIASEAYDTKKVSKPT